jgi:hypothetical protein
MRILLFCLIGLISISSFSQSHYWQQEAAYKMEIDFNVEKHQFSGIQELEYTNNSTDTLSRVFYHLYFNAFQKGSMMDVRSRNIEDPDRRVGDRIFELKKEEEGYQKINSLTQNGKVLSYNVEGTILEVELAEPILPNSKTVFKMDFEAQVPIQVRRSGRDNAEGIAYSMTQWYPKMAEYDFEGWHANPYIGREFHGVWGTFDIKIKMDSAYTIAGTGYLQNKAEVGKGYAISGSNTSAKIEWHFKSPKVHDFVWAADKNYKQITHQVEGGPLLRFFYVPSEKTVLWDSLPKYTALIFQKMNEKFGVYPYDEYAVIQGGDGGMEYAMATLITGHRSKGSLIGVTAHEAIHSWYQHVLATNESFYSWMDEGFTSYAEDVVLAEILPDFNPFEGSYRSYYNLVTSGKQMPMSTHADWYHTNRAYGVASYSMGCIFLHQLSYIIGQEALNKGMLTYFNQWKFKHPTPTDFKRIMEKESGMELDWYFDQWLKSTNTIDYAIQSTSTEKKKTTITLERKGEMPMPIDITVKLKSGKDLQYYIPLTIMRAEKKENTSAVLLKDWPWTYPAYEFTIDVAQFEIETIEIDPSKRMADIDQTNNTFPRSKESTYKGN